MKEHLWKICFGVMTIFVTIPFLLGAAKEDVSMNSNKPGQINQGEAPNFGEVSVHDPSIIKEGDTYYAFGTHIEAAKSKDLINWERFTNGYETPGNALYGDLSQNLAESFQWAGEDDADSLGGYAVWAPEIFYNEHYVHEDGTKGAYMIYYSASSTYIRSAIGYAVAKDIEGPYEYVDTLVYSGFTEEEAYDNNSTVNKQWENTNIKDLIENEVVSSENDEWFYDNGGYNNTMYPNAIDANLFYDEEGKLWMTYGSWSGGIFMLELDKETGQAIYPGEDGATEDGRMIDRYFGTKIAGGYAKSGEGPYVVYDEKTGYYYLYMTYGWLGADGGYNMRVFRSKNPKGPYLDAQGQDAVLPGNVSNHTYGNKIMGNFLFDRKVGDPGEGLGYGYKSPGHNSVYLDQETDEHFLVFHTKFPEKGEVHQMRVHSIYMNEDDWPVVAPYRYSGETLEKVNRQDITGVYKYINHGKEYSGDIITSEYITLHKNNKVSGAANGTWKKTSHNQAELTINGETYKGVFTTQWNPDAKQHVMTFTAMSDQGVAIWGSKQKIGSDEEVVNAVYEDLDLGDTNEINNDLDLPTEGTANAEINWTTSDNNVITNSGEITRPEAGEEANTATLTASIRKGEEVRTKTFDITVLPVQNADLVAHFPLNKNLEDVYGSFGTGTPTGDRLTNSGGTISFQEGIDGNAAYFDGSSGVLLPNNLITNHEYSVSFWLKPNELTPYTTTFFGGSVHSWISLVPNGPAGDRTMLWSGENWYDADASYQINTNEWTHVAFSVHTGTVKLYLNGEEEFVGSNFPDVFSNVNASFGLGVNHWDTPYQGLIDDLRIYDGELTSTQIDQLANQN
ncbi:glycoside hydrolase family 43 C-terminal domain-containing protein [Gracilibacillus sp. YIM 98692]|uniref:lipocalin-like domain-containing protein n=1 Tax=Gracilibacillus sp. YIM 98692 TaxID=2663532 RepID=UPI001F089772|nr:glycoside hydrolase family 43 C-terminal domain-containing protein [Gracilibacillus sp. YIM 98692]